jgi:hypothetical protein
MTSGTVQHRVLGNIVAEQARRTFVGRERELSLLLKAINDDGYAVVYLHGIAGIGKSRLLSAFAERAHLHGWAVILIDCRAVEPTEQGFLRELGSRLGKELHSPEEASKSLGSLGSHVVLALDHYEVLRLLDSWLRHTFVSALPSETRLILADREAPIAAWAAAPGWGRLFRSLELDALPSQDATALLTCLGIPESRAEKVNRVARGHPLALTLAASSLADRQDPGFDDFAIHRVIHELTQLYLAEIVDPMTRQTLQAACVLRRVTVSLLNAMLADVPAHDAFSRMRSLPFVHIGLDGLRIHDSVKQVIAAALQASDPSKFRDHRRAAWSQLRSEVASAPNVDLWRYTADMLYLLENPVIREAFFPTSAQIYAVEPAFDRDGGTIRAIAERHEGAESARSLCQWWTAAPEAFSVVRDQTGETVGFYCIAESTKIPESIRHSDAVVKSWLEHLHNDPLPKNQKALFLRRWLSELEGEQPSPIQAASWLDIKRIYLSLRPQLRRVYLTLENLGPYAAAAQTLGFARIPGADICLDRRTYSTVMLDFGPSSVDGWLARLVGGELGVVANEMLDIEARELVIDNSHIPLTPLEFAVFRYLREREGKAVGREALIHDVWGLKHDVGSNVVDVVIKSLRKKLGNKSDLIETVAGHGYKIKISA